MSKRKPKINFLSEDKRELPSFPVKTAAVESRIIALRADDCELVEKRKPQLREEPLVVKKELPFILTSKPLPPPSPNAYPSPPVQKTIPESEYLNLGPTMSEEAKAQQIFMVNYAATYGKVSKAEANAAFKDHTKETSRSNALSKDADARLKMARKQTQWPNWLHVGLIMAEVVLFIFIYIARGGLLVHWYF